MVVMLTGLLLSVVAVEFQFTSQVNYRMAINSRDALQAEYNALSALRLRSLVLRQSRKFEAALGGVLGALGGDASARPPIAQLMEMIPIDCGVLDAMMREAETFEEEDKDFFTGDCLSTAQSEHSKIPINMLRNFNNNRSQQVTRMLVGLLSNIQFERHFQEDDRNGTHAESAQELVGAITDWIDADTNQVVNNVADEGRFYAQLDDTYEPKNAPFDSVAELQLVHGIDDELYDMLSRHVTVYADSTQIDLATAPLDRVWLALLSTVPPGTDTSTLLTSQSVAQFDRSLREMRMVGGSFGLLNVQTLTALIQQFGLDTYFDTTQFSQVFSNNSGSTWYTIQAQGRVGDVVRHAKAIFQSSEGQYYYYRIE